MKMEYFVKANSDGVVDNVMVSEGQAVQLKQKLVSVSAGTQWDLRAECSRKLPKDMGWASFSVKTRNDYKMIYLNSNHYSILDKVCMLMEIVKKKCIKP